MKTPHPPPRSDDTHTVYIPSILRLPLSKPRADCSHILITTPMALCADFPSENILLLPTHTKTTLQYLPHGMMDLMASVQIHVSKNSKTSFVTSEE